MKIDVKKVAKLANLSLKAEEIKKYEEHLSSILSYIDLLNKLDLKDVEETSQVTGLENVTREDTAESSLTQEEATSQAKQKHNGLFQVPALLGEGMDE